MSVFIFSLLVAATAAFFFNDIRSISFNRRKQKSTVLTAKEYVDKLCGKVKVSYLAQNIKSVKDILNKTQMSERYSDIMRRSVLLAVIGAAVGLVMRNVFLSVVLCGGLYFIPMWTTRFSLYRYKKVINEELEIALSLITTSYMRSSDILKAVSENLENINYPVNTAFAGLVNSLTYVSSDVPCEIDKLKSSIDNSLFHEWCDLLIMCQNNHTLKFVLLPVVQKFSDLKAQQLENETNMMLPLKNTVKMILIVLATVPILYFFSSLWFYSLAGQLMLAITAAVIFWCLDAAIKLSAPVEYNL